MSTSEVLEKLKHISNADRLAVIETASRLIREELTAQPVNAREELDRRMRKAAIGLKDLYEPGGLLTEWTSLDSADLIRIGERLKAVFDL